MRWIYPCKKGKKVLSRFKQFWFYLSWHKQHGNIKQTSDIIWGVLNKPTTVWVPTKKLLVSWQFSGTYGVTKYGSGWRKDVINQCLEFGQWCGVEGTGHSSEGPGFWIQYHNFWTLRWYIFPNIWPQHLTVSRAFSVNKIWHPCYSEEKVMTVLNPNHSVATSDWIWNRHHIPWQTDHWCLLASCQGTGSQKQDFE